MFILEQSRLGEPVALVNDARTFSEFMFSRWLDVILKALYDVAYGAS